MVLSKLKTDKRNLRNVFGEITVSQCDPWTFGFMFCHLGKGQLSFSLALLHSCSISKPPGSPLQSAPEEFKLEARGRCVFTLCVHPCGGRAQRQTRSSFPFLEAPFPSPQLQGCQPESTSHLYQHEWDTLPMLSSHDWVEGHRLAWKFWIHRMLHLLVPSLIWEAAIELEASISSVAFGEPQVLLVGLDSMQT